MSWTPHKRGAKRVGHTEVGESIGSYSDHNPYWTSSLFNEIYLRNDVPRKYASLWEADAEFDRFQNDFHNFVLEQNVENFKTWSESDTIDNWIVPVMAMLGWHDRCEGRQTPYVKELSFTVSEEGRKKVYRLDLAYMNDPKFKQYTTAQKNSDDRLREARNEQTGVQIVVEAKYWDRIEQYRQNHKEDRKRCDLDSGDGARALSPDDQILKYLEILHRDFGILTDGKTWRLYHREHSKSDIRRFFEFDLGNLSDLVRGGLTRPERETSICDMPNISFIYSGRRPLFRKEVACLFFRSFLITAESTYRASRVT